MCLIIHQQAGDRLTRDEVIDIYRRNRDGFGVMWIDRGVQIWKTLPADADEAWKAYEWLAGYECVLHWRMATHGAVTVPNAHPHVVVENEIALVHNGVFSQFGSKESSDTVEFTQHLQTFVSQPEHLTQPDVAEYLDKLVTGSSVVFATPSGFRRIGRAGVTVGGRWYSNTYAWSAPWSLVAPGRPVAMARHTHKGWRYAIADAATDLDDAADAVAARVAKHVEDSGYQFDEPCILTDGSWSHLCITLSELLEDASELDLADMVAGAIDDETQAWIVDEAIDSLQSLCAPGLSLQLTLDTLHVVEDWRDVRDSLSSYGWGD